MTENPHQRELAKRAERFDMSAADVAERSAFWENEAERLAGVADALLLQWRDLASRVSKSSLRYDQDGD